MAEFKKKDKYHLWHSPLALGALFIIFAVFLYNMLGLMEKERETNKKKELILNQIDLDKQREQNLSDEIAKLKTTEGEESAIREKYQVVKPGEKMVVIVDEKQNTDNTTNETNTDHSFWGWIKRTFRL